MARRRRQASKQALAQQEAGFRRGAPGHRFVGDAGEQRDAAVRAERAKVQRMAEVSRAERTAEAVGVPIIAMLADVAQSALRIGGLLVRAPFLVARALLRPREA